MRIFFLVLARDSLGVAKKARELDSLGFPYIIVCGERVNHHSVVYREPRGKYDAINFGSKFVPRDVEIVGLNDVDTEISNLKAAICLFEQTESSLVFAKVNVLQGPQRLFYRFLDALRKRVLITASGELMLIRHDVLRSILPLKSCKAEDSYILFKVLEKRYSASFCEECFVTTGRTVDSRQEEDYKRRTVGGIYQALSMTKPPLQTRFFYMLLPFASLVLLVLGGKGYYWVKGILRGFVDYLIGDRSGAWEITYPKNSCKENEIV